MSAAAPVVTPALEAQGVTVTFGGITALSDVTVAVAPAQIAGLVGPNGAGKSTLLAVLSGFQRAGAGRVLRHGADVTRHSPERRARGGLARSFQQPQLFADLTVREHLVLAHRVRHARRRLATDLVTCGALRRPAREETEVVDRILADLGLEVISHRPALGLSLGWSRLVELGRALATGPDLLLLDEPLSGLDQEESVRIAATLARIVRSQDIALIIVEHDVDAVLNMADIVFVLDFGVRIAAGTPAEIRRDPAVRAAYLGDEGDTTGAPSLESPG